MAKSSSFTYTNKAETAAKIKLVKVNEQTDYGVTSDEPTACSMTNITAPMGQEEIITNFCTPISKVNSKLTVAHPSPVSAGIQYGVRVDSTLVTVDDSDATYEVDEPIVVQISVRHQRSTNFNSTLVTEAVNRAVSAFYGDLFDATQDHVASLMKSALQPMADFAE